MKHTKAPVIRYLALGDSYTIGESVDSTLRYPVQLADTLNQLEINTDAPEIIAVTGWTTGELIAGIEKTAPQGPYNLVSLLIGVNNQYRGMDIEIYKKEFEQLLEQAIGFADNHPNRVLVLSIPDWGVTPFASERNTEKIALEIDQYNAINKEITLSKKCHWINVTEISRKAASDDSLIANDGLHPSGAMYSEWVKEALPVVLQIVNHQ